MTAYEMSKNSAKSSLATAFLNRVYLLMTLGLLVTAVVAYYFHSNPQLTQSLVKSSFTFFGIIIVQLAAVLFFSAMVSKMKTSAAYVLFFVYAALTGVTFGILSFVYTAQDISYAFVITAGSFFGLSIIGYTTKKDLGPIRSFCFMGLIGLIILSVMAMFIPSFRSNTMELMMGAIGVIVFAGLTAYDTQKIKEMSVHANHQVFAISGAFTLYLDFINLFISILRLFGDRR